MTTTTLTTRLRHLTTPQPVWPDRFDGIYLGWGHRRPVFSGPEHPALVIGPPRSGKTAAIVIPAVALWPGPAVVTSTKSDVLAVTARYRSDRGTIWHWDPTGTTLGPPGTQPLRWSPATGCEEWDVAVARAWALAAAARPGPRHYDSHWVERAQALLAPLLHAAALVGADLAAVMGWLHRREVIQPLSLLDHPHSGIAQGLLQGVAATDPREQSGIWSTADSILAAYRTHHALEAARCPNFDPASFATSTDTVYICAPAQAQHQHAPLICALLDQIRTTATARTQPAPPVLWALDEVANIAPLPNLPSVVADAGGQGLLVLACLQDLSQARTRWENAADGFLTLFPTTTILPGVADPSTLRTVTTLAGLVDRDHRSRTRGPHWTTTHTITSRQEPLLPESVVAHGTPGRALHLRSTHPTWLNLTPWYSTPGLRALLDGSAT